MNLEFKEGLLFLYFSLREINQNIAYRNFILNLSLFRLASNSRVKKIMYPFEGRNWESVLVKNMNDLKKFSLGYVHSAITPRNLILSHGGFLAVDEMPEKIITYSEMGTKILNQSLNPKNLKTGYFISNFSHDPSASFIVEDIVQIALNGSVREAKEIIETIAKMKDEYKKRIFVRPNPNDKSFKLVKKYSELNGVNLYKIGTNSIPKVCFFRSSTVALEYLVLGVKIVYLQMDEIVTANIFEYAPEVDVEVANIMYLKDRVISYLDFGPVKGSVIDMGAYKYMINRVTNNNQLLNVFK